MNILIVNYYYEPFVGAHAYRWSQIAKEWCSQGHNVDVLTGRTGSVKSEIRSGVNVTRTGLVRKTIDNNAENKKNTNNIYKKFTLSLVKRVYRFFYWPDGLWHWLPFILADLLNNRKKRYDLIVSYSPTFCAHLGVGLYKKFSNNKSYWILDYGDPFSISDSMQPNNFLIYRKFNYLIERFLIEKGDLVVFTNELTREEYARRLSINKTKTKVIPHAVDLNLFFHKGRVFNDGVIRCVYIGALHKGIREPYLMLEFFNSLPDELNVTLDIYGPLNNLSEISLNIGCAKYHGAVTREKAIELTRCADILINIENENCVMTPSKVVEYAATGLPILNFYKTRVSDIFCEQGLRDRVLHIKDANDLSAACEFILRCAEKKASLDEVRGEISNYCLSSIAREYLINV